MTETSDPITFYLALPSYNEGERIAQFLPGLCMAIMKSDLKVRVQIVDDGSSFLNQGHYRSLMELLQPTFPFLMDPLTLDKNQGKGNAVYAGWRNEFQADMLALADADGAVGPSEIVRVFRMIANDPLAKNALFAASRIKSPETEVARKAIRNLGGLTFRWLRKQLFPFGIEDTQCGFKVVPQNFFTEYQHHFSEGGFAFYLEILYRAQQANLKLTEVPVTWTDIKGSHMTLKSSIGLFRDLLKLKGRLDRETDSVKGP